MVFDIHSENDGSELSEKSAQLNSSVAEGGSVQSARDNNGFKERRLSLGAGGMAGGKTAAPQGGSPNKEREKISNCENSGAKNNADQDLNNGPKNAVPTSGRHMSYPPRPKLSLSGASRRDAGQNNRGGQHNQRGQTNAVGADGLANNQSSSDQAAGKQGHIVNGLAVNIANSERVGVAGHNGKAEQVIYNLKELRKQSAESLITMAESLNIDSSDVMAKHNLIFAILKRIAEQNLGRIYGEGVLEILPEGYGFLRSYEANYVASPDDIYVSQAQVKSYRLRTGDTISGPIRAPHNKNERYFALVDIVRLNGIEPSKGARHRVHFDDLTPLYPDRLIQLESLHGAKSALSARIIDLMVPLGRGQRAIIVAPPKAGKTTLMQEIAHSITENHPDITLIVLLIDERPEEVTDMARSVRGEVVSSTFDEPSSRHVQLAEMVIEKAKRLAEVKKDVVILLDSITRLARAYNNVAPSSGKVLSGGVDSYALTGPKRFFGAARNLEEGGSLTIIATALIDTGSRMDEVIFEEFKGTGNCEIVLDRKTSDRGTYPAIDLMKSGTRKDELLLNDEKMVRKVRLVKRLMSTMGVTEAVEFFLPKIRATRNNEEFLQQIDTYNQKTVKTMGDA